MLDSTNSAIEALMFAGLFEVALTRAVTFGSDLKSFFETLTRRSELFVAYYFAKFQL